MDDDNKDPHSSFSVNSIILRQRRNLIYFAGKQLSPFSDLKV